jgi:hypothetical protein
MNGDLESVLLDPFDTHFRRSLSARLPDQIRTVFLSFCDVCSFSIHCFILYTEIIETKVTGQILSHPS